MRRVAAAAATALGLLAVLFCCRGPAPLAAEPQAAASSAGAEASETAGMADKAEEADDSATIDPMSVNAACYVCHMTFIREELSRGHLPEKITCIDCHGLSAAHANDENIGATPPDVTFERDEVDGSCRECHGDHDAPGAEVVARFVERELTDHRPICTDCHGTHKIEQTEEDGDGDGGGDDGNGSRPKEKPADEAEADAAAPAGRPAAEPQFVVPNHYEEEAVAAGRKLGIGSAELEGPKSAEVLSHQTWTLIYTAGKAGIQPGGGIRIGMRHLSQWSQPQTTDPREAGYLTVKTSNGAPVKVAVDFRRRFFLEYFAWHNMVEVIVPERGLAPGETIRLTYGDRSGGSPGMRVQPFDERRFVFKVYVDAPGEGDYLPIARSPAVEIVAAEPHRLSLVMPSDAVAGEPTWCLVRAEDRYGNPAPRYRGTIRLKSTDPDAKLPAAYTFAEADRGVHRFDDVVFAGAGNHTMAVGDGAMHGTGNPVQVAASRPERLLLWGDLHGHTLQSDGRGTVEEYYDFAERVAGLDFCAVSDHAFEVLDEMWAHSKAVTNRLNRPGRFVTFNAYEWSGNTNVGGDHNVYFLGDDPPIYRSDNYYHPGNLQMDHGPEPKVPHVDGLFAKLEAQLDDHTALCIPHWGGRHGNPRFHKPKVQRLIEIFSEHQRSEDWAKGFLAKGHRLGIIASGDGHYGNPGYGYLRPTYAWGEQEIGMGVTAVYAEEHTREAIFAALRNRRCYATSGDRIVLDFRCDGHPMGSEYRTDAPPGLSVKIVGTAPVTRVEIKRNGQVVFARQPQATDVSLKWRDDAFPSKGPCYYYVRAVQANGEEAVSSPVWVE